MPSEYLVHFSDLHLPGLESGESWATFQLAETVCRQLKPRVLVVSGDFCDHPRKAAMRAVKERLDALCRQSADCQLVVVPGNHDCKLFGLYAFTNPLARFEKVFGSDWKKPVRRPIGKRDVALFCFDSNTSNPQINFARGRVGTQEYARFNSDYSAQAETPGFERTFKIAVLHHHPLPIAASDVANYLGKDAFLGLEDAGSFMEEIIAKRIDLVLHGHKHFPLFARIQVANRDIEESGTVIVAAGSTSKPSASAKNSFNVVAFHEDGTVDVSRYDRDQAGFERRRKTASVLSYEAFRQRAFEAAVAESDRVTELQAHSYLIDRFGDCQRSLERRALTVPLGKPDLDRIKVDKHSPTGSFAGFSVRSTSVGFADPEFQETSHPKEGELIGEILLKPALGSDSVPIGFEESWRVFNAFAFNEDQRFRMHGEKGPEFVGIIISAAVVRLLVCLQFPPELLPANITLEVGIEKDSCWTPNTRETNWAQRYLHVSALTSTVTLTVSKPLHRHTYRLRWPLPTASSRVDSAQIQGQSEAIRKKLLELDVGDRSRNHLQPLFGQALNDLAKIFPPLSSGEEMIDLGLMVYDSSINKLRYVAGYLRDEFWIFSLYEGRGAAGRAHKLNQALLYVPRRMSLLESYGLKTPPGIDPPELQLCIPLRFPIEAKDGWVVGVLTLSTSSLASSLLQLRDSEEKKAGLLAFLYAFYGQKVLPSLGIL